MDFPNDSIDARLIKRRKIEEIVENSEPMGVLNISVDSNAYDMSHKRRGQCVVFNHKVFESQTGCKERLGTDRDAQEITDSFLRLEFDVTLVNDASHSCIQQEMSKISTADHTDNDCVVVVVLTHGDEHSLYARDYKYETETLFRYFDGNKCPTLAGKPKIFIIQACRGTKLDSGVKLKALGPAKDVTDNGSPVYRIPTIADYLIYYSTAPGHYSFRNNKAGSCFIQAMATVLDDFCNDNVTIDLVTLFTKVNLKVALEFESDVSETPEFDRKKQIPCISSMLTRLINFQPKPELIKPLFKTLNDIK